MLFELSRIRLIRALILALFVLSGAAALIYEVVWFQLLRLTIGASAISLGIILATFMGGLCLGSFYYHRFVKDRHHPLAAYGLLELGIGAFGILNPLLLPMIGGLYFNVSGYGYGDIILRGSLAALFLLPPTILMGATLPAISRWVAHSRQGAASLGFFYAANIAGAVLGCTLAGFYLLRVYDIYVASGVAVLANVLGGVLALALARRTPARVQGVETSRPGELPLRTAPDVARTRVLWLIGLSGVTALGAQVVWTRLLSLYFGGTVYTFSVILAVFLVGLGLGSMAGTRLAQTSYRPLLVLAATQLLLLPALWWAQFAIQDVIHNLFFFGIPPGIQITEPNWIARSFNDVIVAAVVLTPATVLWGASFPLAMVLASGDGRDPGRFTGQVYAANTLGAVVGAVVWSMLLIPTIGTRSAQQVLMVVALTAVAIVWLPQAIKQIREGARAPQFTTALSIVLVTVGLIALLPKANYDLMAFGRAQEQWGAGEFLTVQEGINSTVMVSLEIKRNTQEIRQLHVSGKVVASNTLEDMRLQRQLGHLPVLVHENPKSVLVIGFGAGVTAGVFTRYQEIERIVIIEIEPAVPRASSRHFKSQNHDVANDPRTEIIIDDGRHFLATTDEKFDIITTDPIHPWMKGAASLYTSEFYELVKARLNPGGVITQWVPMYESDESAVKSQIASFFEAFPEGSVWNSQERLMGYDLTLLGHVLPLKINDAASYARLTDNIHARDSLLGIGIKGLPDLFKLYSGNRSDLRDWLSDAQINRDRNLRLEYLAGAAVDVQIAPSIYANMIDQVTYPKELFDFEPQHEALMQEYFRKVNATVKLRRQKLEEKQTSRDDGVD
jgi:spermidine synthase